MDSRTRFFRWIAMCCKSLGWPSSRGAELIADPGWFSCFEDGMTPEQAVDAAVLNGVVVPIRH